MSSLTQIRMEEARPASVPAKHQIFTPAHPSEYERSRGGESTYAVEGQVMERIPAVALALVVLAPVAQSEVAGEVKRLLCDGHEHCGRHVSVCGWLSCE
jgi:hypothetical protein